MTVKRIDKLFANFDFTDRHLVQSYNWVNIEQASSSEEDVFRAQPR